MFIFLLNYLIQFLVPHLGETEFFYLYVKVLSLTQASFQCDEKDLLLLLSMPSEKAILKI